MSSESVRSLGPGGPTPAPPPFAPDGSRTEIRSPAPAQPSPPPATDPSQPDGQRPAPPLTSKSKLGPDKVIDLQRRRDQLNARVAELQWDLGGMVYEMAVRDRVRVDVIVKRAAILQDADAELAEVERILRLEETGTAGVCATCGAPHSVGASFCWQCGRPLLQQLPSDAIARDARA